jgi:N-acyl-D-aspartate/D-glutamate deacylase
MRTIAISVLLILSLCVTGLAAAEVKSDYDRAFDMSRLQSFRFADHSRRSPKDALASDELAAKRLHSAIQNNLVGLGMQQQATGADFEVFYFATLRNQAQVTTSGRPRWGMGAVWVDQYVQGTVVVQFLDAKSGELIWRGFVTDAVDPAKSEEKINKGIKKLIDRFAKDREKQKKAGR